MTLDKHFSEQPLTESFNKSTWNQAIDTINRSTENISVVDWNQQANEQILRIMVINDSGEDLEKGEPVELTDGGWDVADHAYSTFTMRNYPLLANKRQTGGEHKCDIGICEQPIQDGKIGWVAVRGLYMTEIETLDEGDLIDYVGIANAKTQPVTDPAGPFRVIWREPRDPPGETTAYTGQAILALEAPRNITWLGVAAEDIVAGQEGPVDLAPGGVQTGYQIIAEFKWVTNNEDISKGKQVIVMFFPDKCVWRIIGAECEDEADEDWNDLGDVGT